MALGYKGSSPLSLEMNIFSLLAIINNLYKQRKLVLRLRFKISYLVLIKTLLKFNLILHYFIKSNIIYIYLNYFNFKPIFSYIKLVSTPAKKVLINYKELTLLSMLYSTSVILLSTPYGYIPHRKALHLKTGGVIIAQYY